MIPFADEAAFFVLIVQGLALLLFLGGGIIALIGSFMCIGTPEASGLKTLALLGAIFNLLILPVGFILSMLFLRGVGKHFGNRKLASGALTYMIVALIAPCVLCLASVAVFFLAVVSRARVGEATMTVVVLFAVWAGAVLALFLWYMGILRDAQHTISRAVRRATA
jgi:hypothetical protein